MLPILPDGRGALVDGSVVSIVLKKAQKISFTVGIMAKCSELFGARQDELPSLQWIAVLVSRFDR
jgi:uncharacterized protein YaiE (UPF0345 family)